MNLEAEELKERVFELVAREARDPEGVREFLAQHPEYRASFERIKATLALSAELPLEEPPESLDAAILEALDAWNGEKS